MPRISKFPIILGSGVLCAVTAASVTAASWPSSPVASQASMADLANVTHAQSGSLAWGQSAAALAAQRAASLQAQKAAGVQDAKDAVAQNWRALDLAAVNATAAHEAHQAHVILLAKRAAAARAAAAGAAAAKAAAAKAAAARQAAAQQASSGSSSSTQTTAQSVPSGSPQQIAQQMLDAAGQGGQFSCLDSLWNRESGWNVYASNPGSGAYGIPQALPGSKMASAGPDWQSNAATQIRWGLSYIDSMYGSPCGAWAHEEADGWY